MNKYLAFFLKDQFFILHFVILTALGIGLIVFLRYESKQAQLLKTLQRERELVLGIDPMKNQIRSKMIPKTSPNAKWNGQLQGVFYQNKKVLVLINNTVYQEGDVLGDYKLLKINLNSLVLLNLRTQQKENIIFGESLEELLQKSAGRN